jgi:hypothetical protein
LLLQSQFTDKVYWIRGGPGSNPGLVMWDFVMDKSGAGAGFLRLLRFPLPIYNPSASPQSSSLSPEPGTIGQEWPHKANKKKSICSQFMTLLTCQCCI